jgi:hypothetical protein
MRISNKFRKLIYDKLEYDRDKYYLKIYAPLDYDKIWLIFNNKRENGQNYTVFMRKKDDFYELYNDNPNNLKVFPSFIKNVESLKKEFLSFYTFIKNFDDSILFYSNDLYYDDCFFGGLPELSIRSNKKIRYYFNFSFNISENIDTPFFEIYCSEYKEKFSFQHYNYKNQHYNYKKYIINNSIAKKIDKDIDEITFEDLKILKLATY